MGRGFRRVVPDLTPRLQPWSRPLSRGLASPGVVRKTASVFVRTVKEMVKEEDYFPVEQGFENDDDRVTGDP